ncbi:hypothetical protein HZB03_03485 [Candidatus Woesearchaeota archaeon]|nr:hypothetical protein [Candidatus Woesearchaeota archaeon]
MGVIEKLTRAGTFNTAALLREIADLALMSTSWTPPAAIDPLALELQSDFRFAPIGRRTLSSIERSEILRGGLIREAFPYGDVDPRKKNPASRAGSGVERTKVCAARQSGAVHQRAHLFNNAEWMA